MTSKQRIKSFLFSRGQATNAEIAEYMNGLPGQLSWGQRLREIRQELKEEGGDLVTKEMCRGIYLYTVILPPKIEANGQLELNLVR